MRAVPRVLVRCKECGKEFLIRQKDIDRGKGKYCSLSCSGRGGNIGRIRLQDQNSNWKGGISKNNYHYKLIQNERHPEKIRARELLALAVLRGDVKKLPCCVCGTDKDIQAHHPDYSKPLDVQWLCRKHHREIHGGMKYHVKQSSTALEIASLV